MTMKPERLEREFDKFEENPGDGGTDVRVVLKNVDPIPVDIGSANVTVLGDSKISGTVDGTDSGTERTFVNNLRQQVLSSHDLVSAYTWFNFGTKNERFATITYTSATFPGVTVVQTYNYTLVGTAYRLDSAPFVTTPGG